MVTQINSDNFQKEVLDYKGVVFVDLYADWCGPCKMTSPIVEELSEKMKDIKFVKINVDENQQLAAKYNIFSIPTFMMFKDGKLANQFVGGRDKASFVAEINKVVK